MFEAFKSKKVNMSVKSKLAKLLAAENITVEHKKVSTAMFDPQKRVLTLPLWKDMAVYVVDMLIGHEVGHALWSPRDWVKYIDIVDAEINGITTYDKQNPIDVMRRKGIATFINVVEDARIEKRIKGKYPGLKSDFISAYIKLYHDNFFGTKGEDINSFPLIDRLNITMKLGNSLEIPFMKEEKPYVREMEDLITFDDVMELVKKLYKYSKDHNTMNLDFMTIEEESGENDDQEENDDDGEEGGFPSKIIVKKKKKSSATDIEENGDAGNSSLREKDKKEKDESGSSASGQGEKKEKKDKKNSNIGSTSHGDGIPGEPAPISRTDETWQFESEKLVDTGKKETLYLNIPVGLNFQHMIGNHKDVHKHLTQTLYPDEGMLAKVTEYARTFRADNAPVVAYLIKEFEMKKAADQYNKTKIAKTGQLDMNKIHSYQYNEDIFRRVTILPGGKNHGLVMFIDWSSSMNGNLAGTIDQLLNLILFCRKLQIPFEVYGYSNNDAAIRAFNKSGILNYKPMDVVMNKFTLMNFFSSTMNAKEFDQAFTNMVGLKLCFDSDLRKEKFKDLVLDSKFITGGTPLNDSIILSNFIVAAFRKKYNIQILNVLWLTDGDSDNNSRYKDENGSEKTYNYITHDVIYRDPITKNEYMIGNINPGIRCTANLLELLSDRTNVKNIGFYITSGASLGSSIESKFDSAAPGYDKIKLLKQWNEERYVVSTKAGYDQYYIIPGGNILQVEKETIKDGSAAALITFNKNKLANRVVLRKFIEQITRF